MTTAERKDTTAAPATNTPDPTQDRASTSDKARLERDAEKMKLVSELSVLADRADALDQLVTERKSRLDYLMSQDSDRRITTPAGTAAFEPKRKVSVVDPKLAAEKLDPLTMAEYLAPTTGLADALTAAKVALSSVGLEMHEGDALVVRRPQTNEAKEHRKIAIERTKAETEATIARIVARINKAGGTPPTT